MNTNFFSRISALAGPGTWSLSVRIPESGRIAVTALYKPEKCDDEAHKLIPPMVLKGTFEELDEGFFGAIAQPVAEASALFVNMQSYMNDLETARKQAKMNTDKKTASKPATEGAKIEVPAPAEPPVPKGPNKEEKRKAYDEAMKQVDELKDRMKYDDALALLPAVDEYHEKEAELTKLRGQLNSWKSQFALFNQ